MNSRLSALLIPLGALTVVALLFLAERRPALFTNTTYLGAILALQVVLLGLSRFEVIFFPLLMGTFLWAGSSLPFSAVGSSLRWLLLAAGALGGFVIWIKSPRSRHFGAFHLIAVFCVIAALVSSLVSETPRISLLKVGSLFLMFLYGASGARVAIAGREAKFIAGLVLACEALVYLSAISQFALGFSTFGNPNALGAIISVAAVPVLLWAALVAETRGLRQRRFVALAVCGVLLYSVNARAALLAAAAVIVMFTVAVRHQRLLMQSAFVCVFFVTVMAVFNPTHIDEMASSLAGRVIFKKEGIHNGILGSRLSPWSDTLTVVKRHPWFGSGFGTSELGEMRPQRDGSSVYTVEGTNREHGNSYLAMAEYMGLLGAVPFVALLFMLVQVLFRTCRWMRRTGSPYHFSIPFALIAIAGLVHAGFEDWLFAVGSYLCLFFWAAAFILVDLAPPRLEAGAGLATSRFVGAAQAQNTIGLPAHARAMLEREGLRVR